MNLRVYIVLPLALGMLACSGPSSSPRNRTDSGQVAVDAGGPEDVAPDMDGSGWRVDDYFMTSEVGAVPAYDQRSGDPDRGYDILVNEGYVSCGVPARIWDQFLAQDVPAWAKLPGRRGANAEMAFNQTRFDRDGIELVSTNCLACHANTLPDGRLFVGLGYEGDYTTDLGRFAELGRGLVDEENEREVFEYDRFLERTLAVQPHIRMETIGVNPADNIASALAAHRDPDTWAWLPEPWFELPEPSPIPLSVPPFWHAKKKNALYYTTIGRGDHARFMMAAALLCTDSIEEAREIDEMFVHVQAYIESIEAPEYPYRIDRTLADRGEAVFAATCSRCHGTYGVEETYPNLVIDLDEIGTDRVLAEEGGLSGADAVAWFNRSFFGELSIVAPARGYIAPPLDGIWATAPYFHNASVPTLDGVLNSASRPRYWKRSSAFDQAAVGLEHIAQAGGKEAADTADDAKLVYDTSLPGYSNAGHLFADGLSVADRAALLEYLKTL